MTTYNVKIFGHTYRYDLAPKDIIENVCESLAGEYETMYMDGHIAKIPEVGDFCEQCYKRLVAKKLDLYLDGTEITIETPKEVRFFGMDGIIDIAYDIYYDTIGNLW